MNIIRRLVRKYRKWKINELGSQPIVKYLPAGFFFEIDPRSETDQTFYFNTYEVALINFIKNFLTEGDTCIDIGGHKGYITLHLSNFVGKDGCVFTFEPDPNARNILEKNISLNKKTNITISEKALSNEKGFLSFYLNNYLGHSSRFPNKYAKKNVAKEIQVEVDTLDSILEQFSINGDRLSFVKIDAEGSEEFILKGFTKLQEILPVIHMEFNFRSFESAGTNLENFIIWLKNENFEFYDIRCKRDYLLRFKNVYTKIFDFNKYTNTDMIDVLIVSKKSKYYEHFLQVIKG
jgi:FkbM family methyltransferase